MRFSTLLLAATLAFGALAPTPAEATSQVLLTDVEHAKESTAVVHATVGDSWVELDPELGRPITKTKIQVKELLFGDAPRTVVVEQMGGEWDGQVLYVAGDARMKAGEDVVLFLADRRGHWMFTAMEQSKYSVEPSMDGPMLSRELTSNFFLRGPQGTLKHLDDLHDPDMRLEDLKKLLAELEGGE